MDNLTHSLVGALLGQAGLKRKTGLAMPALIIGANLPDIDAVAAIYGTQSLAMRRGITHGPVALVLLPILLGGGLWTWDRWQSRRGTRPKGRPPVRFGALLYLSFLACLTHPALDWLNNYGIRLLEPFSNRWFYGDALFIIDPWLIAIMVAAIWLSLRRERAGARRWTTPARAGLAAVGLFIGCNLAVSALAVAKGRASLHTRPDGEELVVANPVPLAFWRREMLVRSGPSYSSGTFALTDPTGSRSIEEGWRRNCYPDIDLNALRKTDPDLDAFLFWSRMPVTRRDGAGAVLRDQRFLSSPVASRFSVALPVAQCRSRG